MVMDEMARKNRDREHSNKLVASPSPKEISPLLIMGTTAHSREENNE